MYHTSQHKQAESPQEVYPIAWKQDFIWMPRIDAKPSGLETTS